MAIDNKEPKTLLRGLPSLKGPFRPLDLDSLPQTPHEAFHNWLQDAINDDVKEAHAMTLSTVDEFGSPDARVLILKNLDHRGWHFAIKADSPKGRQINNEVRQKNSQRLSALPISLRDPLDRRLQPLHLGRVRFWQT
jgi:hypothetical protein